MQSWSVVGRLCHIEKEAVKREAENKERLAWLEELQRDYNVDGSAPRTFNIDSRKKRAFLTPEVRAGLGPCPSYRRPPLVVIRGSRDFL